MRATTTTVTTSNKRIKETLRPQTSKESWRARIRHVESLLRLILEYAVQMWQDIPDYLSDRTESMQKRSLKTS